MASPFVNFSSKSTANAADLDLNFRAADAATVSRLGTGASGGRIEVIAHRGFAAAAPENTLPALSLAIRRGAHAIECDVQVSLDGQLFCYHDVTIDALTEGSGTVTALTASYLDTCVISSTIGTMLAGTVIPRFSEVLKLARRHSVRLYPEIKAYRTSADVALIVAAVVAAGMEDLTVLQSFTLGDLQAVRAANSRIAVGLLGGSHVTDYTATMDSLAALGRAYALWNYTDLIARPGIIAAAESRGVDVAAWTITSAEVARTVSLLGVRRLMTNIYLGGQ